MKSMDEWTMYSLIDMEKKHIKLNIDVYYNASMTRASPPYADNKDCGPQNINNATNSDGVLLHM